MAIVDRAGAALLALLLWAAPALAAGAPQVEVYQPRARTAESLAEVAQTLLGEDGVAVPDASSGALVLRGERSALDQALAAVRALDVAPRSYRIHASLTTMSELSARGVSVGGWIRVGDVRVGRLPGPPEGLSVRLRSVGAQGESQVEAMVAALDGEPAELWTGTTYPERLRGVHERGGELRVYETTALIPVRTGFRVVPRSQADGSVELQLEPVIEERVGDGLVLRAAASSRIRVRPGESVLVASLHERDSAVAIDPFALLDHREGASDAALIVRVEPVLAAGAR